MTALYIVTVFLADDGKGYRYSDQGTVFFLSSWHFKGVSEQVILILIGFYFR